MTDPDIGQCDDCGSEEQPRVPTPRVVTIDGQPALVTAWLCPAHSSRYDAPERS